MDIITYKMAQKYADKVAAGFSSVRVDGLDIIFTLNDGKTATVTVPAPKDSVDGQDGNGIISIEETVKEAIENIKQPLVIDATDIIFLSENSTSEEIFNAFGGKEVIEDIVKNAYIGNTILGRTYAEWGPPNQSFGLSLINIDVSLNYAPYGKFDLDTYPSISIYMSFELGGTRYRIEFDFDRNDSNIAVTFFGEYISEKVVYLSTSIAGLDKDESTQSEINDALRVSTGDIKTTNYNYQFITFKFGYYDGSTWSSPFYTSGNTNKPVLLDAQIIRDTPDDLYNYKIIVKFIDNDNNILKKLVFTRSDEESDFIISSQEELDLSQIITNKTAIETLQSIIPNTVQDNNYVHTDNNYTTEEKTKLANLEEENEALYNDHPDITDTGTDLTLNGTGDLKMKVDVGGNSTQVQYEGYNKLEGDTSYINTNIDNKTNLSLELWLSNSTVGSQDQKILNSTTISSVGRYYYIFTPDSNTVGIVIKHNGAQTDLRKNFSIELQSGITYTISLDITGVNPSIKGGFSFDDVMIYEGTTEKPYEPYVGGTASPNPNYKQDINNVEGNVVVISKNSDNTKSNSVTFPLSQGQKLMLGDILEDDGIHHKRAKVTANELKTVTTYVNQLTDFVRISFMISDLTNKSANAIPSGFCNYLKFLYDYTNESNHFYVRSNVIYVFLEKTLLSSLNVTGVRAFLDEHPDLEIEYELETETTEAYTSAQQTAYNKLKEMQSYYDLTYVVGTSDNAQPIITAHAKKSLKVMQDEIDNIESRLSLLE